MILIIRNRIVVFLASIVGFEAMLVMVGWISGNDQLTRFVSAGSNMRFITAFLFFFSALGLFAMSRAVQFKDELALIVLPGISLVIFLVTSSLLASELFNTSTGIENLFLTSFDTTTLKQVAGGPSLLTLFNFMLFGLVGIASLFPGNPRDIFAVYAGYGIGLSGFVVAIGYFFNVPMLYSMGNIFGVATAFNTALCFILLSVGLTQIYTSSSKQ